MTSLDLYIPDHILLYRILPYIADRRSLFNLILASKKLRNILTSHGAISIWDKVSVNPFLICIDGYCSACHLSRPRSTIPSAIRLLSNHPLVRLQVHCFITDVPLCLEALAKRGTIMKFQLSLTNRSNSPPLDAVLQDEHFADLTSYAFSNLQELSLNSSHLYHVKLPGRARLLDILGLNLKKLEFLNLSPSGVFGILPERCPALKSLRIDKAQTFADLASYHNQHLIELELCRCMFIPEARLNLPSLQKLKFSASFRMEEGQVKHAVHFAPKHISELTIEVPSAYANIAILLIAKNLMKLQSITIESSYEQGKLSERALIELGRRCQLLETIEIFASKSVNTLSFESPAAVLAFGKKFTCLRNLQLVLNEIVLDNLEELVSMPSSLQTVIIKAKKRWVSPQAWNVISQYCHDLNASYSSKHVELEEF